MGTKYRRSRDILASVLTTRLITVDTTATAVTVTSGSHMMQAFNVGPTAIGWGDSAITQGTSGLLFYSMSEIFRPLEGDSVIYFIADSAAGKVLVNEFE